MLAHDKQNKDTILLDVPYNTPCILFHTILLPTQLLSL